MANIDFARAAKRLAATLAFSGLLIACGGGGGGSGSSTPQDPPLVSQAQLNVTPDLLSFDAQAIGTASAPFSVQVTNTGVGPSLPIQINTGSTSSFRVKSTNCSTIQPNSSCTVSFEFKPQTLGSLTSRATITDRVVSASVRLSGESLTGPVACHTVVPRIQSNLTMTEIGERVGVFMPHIRYAEGAPGDKVQPRIIPAPHQPGNYQAEDIRRAYGMPGLPGASAEPASSHGAGQTIYIINAGSSNANVLADLNTFSGAMGLPTCTQRPPNVPMPAAGPTCTLTIVNSGATGEMTSTSPPVVQGWPEEMALDVEWAHAMAPLASIVLIQTAGSRSDYMYYGVALANRMAQNNGGVVSMSFGASENALSNGGASVFTPFFSATNMTYVASTGDDGQAMDMPAGHPNVLAIGGTSLALSFNAMGGGLTARSESVWSGRVVDGVLVGGTGGGISRYTPIPGYQQGNVAIPGQPTTQCGSNFRATADLSMVADPATGVPIVQNGAWHHGVGGTSLSAPAFAGILAVINAQRAVAGRGPLGNIHSFLYSSIYSSAASYASSFNDIVTGNNAPHGGCRLFAPVGSNSALDPTGATCSAGVGYDIPSGLGTPVYTGLAALLPAR